MRSQGHQLLCPTPGYSPCSQLCRLGAGLQDWDSSVCVPQGPLPPHPDPAAVLQWEKGNEGNGTELSAFPWYGARGIHVLRPRASKPTTKIAHAASPVPFEPWQPSVPWGYPLLPRRLPPSPSQGKTQPLAGADPSGAEADKSPLPPQGAEQPGQVLKDMAFIGYL